MNTYYNNNYYNIISSYMTNEEVVNLINSITPISLNNGTLKNK